MLGLSQSPLRMRGMVRRDIASVIRFGELTPIGQGAAAIAASDGTYGEFTVAGGQITPNTSPLTVGTTSVDGISVEVVANAYTVASTAETEAYLDGTNSTSDGQTIYVRSGAYDIQTVTPTLWPSQPKGVMWILEGASGSVLSSGGSLYIDGQPLVADTIAHTGDAPAGTLSQLYQWRRGASPISGATASTYTVVDADFDETLAVDVLFRNTASFIVRRATAPAPVGRVYEEIWDDLSAGMTSSAVKAAAGYADYGTMSLDVIVSADTDAPGGLSLDIEGASGSRPAFYRIDVASFVSANPVDVMEMLFLYRHRTDNGRAWFRAYNDAWPTDWGPGLMKRDATALRHQIPGDDPNSDAGTLLSGAGLAVDGQLYFVRIRNDESAGTSALTIWPWDEAEPAIPTSERNYTPTAGKPHLGPGFGAPNTNGIRVPILFWSCGLNGAAAPYWDGFLPVVAESSDPYSYAAATTATLTTAFDGDIVFNVEDV